MTNRVQVSRSSLTGNRPSGRPPGELYVNWPDQQLGVIAPGGGAVDLVAVRYFSINAAYQIGDHVIQAGKIYHCTSTVATPGAFNPLNWAAYSDASGFMPTSGGTFTGPVVIPAGSTIAGYLALAGGAMTGGLTLASDPTAALMAASKQYVDLRLLLTGGTMTGPLTMNGNIGLGNPFITLRGPQANDFTFDKPGGSPGQYSKINSMTNGVMRWQLWFPDDTAEAGGNVGSDVSIQAYDNSGIYLSTPLKIKRSNGVCTFGVAIVNGPSDRTLKENIYPLIGSLDKINALQGVSFNMKATPTKPEIGLIAQDVQVVVPEVIQTYDATSEDGETTSQKLALDYPKLVAHLIEAVKTLTQRVSALENPTPPETQNGNITATTITNPSTPDDTSGDAKYIFADKASAPDA